jgi:hypothetical protein
MSDWQPITKDNKPPLNTPLLLGYWQRWPKIEWIVEADFYGCNKGGWINSRATHWMPQPVAPDTPSGSD